MCQLSGDGLPPIDRRIFNGAPFALSNGTEVESRAWGITESALFALAITIVEPVGLVAVAAVTSDQLPNLVDRWRELVPGGSFQAWTGVLLGAYLAFYSFVGFEDMVDVAEEVKHRQRNLPIAIFASLGLTAILYVVVALGVVLSVSQEDLVASDSPLSLVFRPGSHASAVITGIGMLDGLNGALVQIVMASRVAYGMALRNAAPRLLADLCLFRHCTDTEVIHDIPIEGQTHSIKDVSRE